MGWARTGGQMLSWWRSINLLTPFDSSIPKAGLPSPVGEMVEEMKILEADSTTFLLTRD
jgi:hypothetical protein